MNERPWVKQYDPGVPASIDYPDQSLVKGLEEAAEQIPEHICTIYEDQALTYREVDDLSSKVAQALIGLGVQKGDRIGILLPNIPEFIEVFYGILKSGGAVVAINPQYHENEILGQVRGSKLKIIFAIESSYQILQRIRIETSLERIIVIPDDKGDLLLQSEQDTWFSSLLNAKAEKILPLVEGRDMAVIQYTGGTTGIPKGAIGLHRNLVANTLQFRHWMHHSEYGKEVFLIAIPMYHVYGMVIGLSLAVSLGASIVLISDPRNVSQLVVVAHKYGVTVFPGVPNIFNLILRYHEAQPVGDDLKSIKVVISGSAPLHEVTLRAFEALISGRICEGYGLSEAPSATHCNPIEGKHKIGSIGLPLPDVECRIVAIDEPQQLLGPNEIGELAIKGPQVMSGYLEMPQETLNTLKDGWLFTGDIATMDEEGYFYLIDRKKEVIKVGGFQVWPNEVEAVINTHPKVLEAGVAGITEELAGEVVIAWVVTRPNQSLQAAEIQEWCRRSLAHYKVPTRVEFIAQLPRSTVGKVLRNELVKRYVESKKGSV